MFSNLHFSFILLVRSLLAVLATKVSRTWEELKAQEVGNALYGLKRMNTEVPEVRILIAALVPKVASSPEILDAQAIGNSFYGLQNMQSDSQEVLQLLQVMAQKVALSCPELDGQAMGNSLYGLQGMSSDYPEVRAVVKALTTKLQTSGLEMNAQEMGNAIYGLQNMTSEHADVRRLIAALTQKVIASRHELTSQEIGNAMFGLQGMSSSVYETRMLVKQLAIKIQQSHSVLDPQGVSNSLFGIQRMSSDCDEVKFLVQALAGKIEHSWKQLSAQHLSNALFGIQCLCSAEPEVRYLLQVLFNKVTACRDELTAKQLGYAIFGLRNMNSDHVEVRNLVQALAEKVSSCNDSWTLQNLSHCLFGMQGMNSDVDEVALMLNALANKCPLIDFSGGDREFNFKMLSNCIFGMQRMSTNSLNLCTILKFLPNVLSTIVSYKVPMENQLFTPAMCANILFGLQNCSCTNQSVSHLLRFVSQSIKTILATVRKDGSVNSGRYLNDPHRQSFRGLDSGDYSFEEMLSLYQALALMIFAMSDLNADAQLHSEFTTHAGVLLGILEARQSEFVSKPLSIAEARLVREVAHKLSAEPFQISSGILAYGFEMAVYVSLECSVPLITLSGVEWSPRLNIEVQGSSYSSPTKALFYSLRNEFLWRQHGVTVVTIPAESFREGRDPHETASGLRHNPSVFDALYPPTPEDAESINSTLMSLGKLQNAGGPMATVAPTLLDYSGSYDSNLSNPRSRMPARYESEQYQVESADANTLNYFDDDFYNVGHNNSEGAKKAARANLSPRNRKPMRIYLGWLGAWPTVLFSGYCVSPITLSNAAVSELNNNPSRYPRNPSSSELTSPNQSVGSAPGSSPYQTSYNRGGFPTNSVRQDKKEPMPPLYEESNLTTTLADTIKDNSFRSTLNLSLNLSMLQPRENQPLQTPSMPYRSHYEEEEILLQQQQLHQQQQQQQQQQLPTPVSQASSSRMTAHSSYDSQGQNDQKLSRYQQSYPPKESRINTYAYGNYPLNNAETVGAPQSKFPPGQQREEGDDASSLGSGSLSKGTGKPLSQQQQHQQLPLQGKAKELENEEGNDGDNDDEIAVIEAQLEVARLEAKLKMAKLMKSQKGKSATVPNTGAYAQPNDATSDITGP